MWPDLGGKVGAQRRVTEGERHRSWTVRLRHEHPSDEPRRRQIDEADARFRLASTAGAAEDSMSSSQPSPELVMVAGELKALEMVHRGRTDGRRLRRHRLAPQEGKQLHGFTNGGLERRRLVAARPVAEHER